MRKFFWVVAIAILAVGCDTDVVFEQNQEIEDGVWNHEDGVDFEFYIEDTVSLHNFLINLRNGSAYPYSNIYMFVEMDFPNGKPIRGYTGMLLSRSIRKLVWEWIGRYLRQSVHL